MKNSEKQISYKIAKTIRESFEESGYLKPQELREYIRETVELELSYKDCESRLEIIEFVYDSTLKHNTYKEFLKGNTLMCSKCSLIKPVSKFNTYKYKDDTLRRSVCKKCEYDKHKMYLKNNKDKQHEYDKKKYNKNKEYYLKKTKIWREKNKDKHNSYNKQYKARMYIKNKLNRDLTKEERDIINNLVKHEGLTGMTIYKKVIV